MYKNLAAQNPASCKKKKLLRNTQKDTTPNTEDIYSMDATIILSASTNFKCLYNKTMTCKVNLKGIN
jgi:hypothetical protein